MSDVFAAQQASEQHRQKAADLETEVRRLRVRLVSLTVDAWSQVPDGQQLNRQQLVAAAVRQLCDLTAPPEGAPEIWKADEAQLPFRLFALLEAAQPRRGAGEEHTAAALALAESLRRSL